LSLSQAEIKRLRSFSTKKGRRTAGLFAAEGVRLLEEALNSLLRPETVYYAPALLAERGLTLVRQFGSLRVKTVEISARDLARVSATATPQGILAVFAAPSEELSQLYRPGMRTILVCENVSDPGNLGTLCRSARAFAFDLVILVGECAEPFSPKVVRASAGAMFGLPVAVTPLAELEAFVRDKGFTLVAADVRGTSSIGDVVATVPGSRLMLAVGSEADGLSEEVLHLAGHGVRVPHETCVESLNAAVAGSILMKECYDCARRRTV
jgi:RNA methyltransferase, TrmH family